MLPEGAPEVNSLHLVGVFAMGHDERGAQGAAVKVSFENGQTHTYTLVSGLHYWDGRDLELRDVQEGDGTNVRTLGTVRIDDEDWRVDWLTIELVVPARVVDWKFVDLGSPASFAILEAFVESQVEPAGCPFHSSTRGISLQELGAVVRIGDADRFRKALQQVRESVHTVAGDLDEARSLALMFLAVTAAALLEAGAPRTIHRAQLEAARALEKTRSEADIVQVFDELVDQIAGHLVRPVTDHDGLMAKVLQLIDRNFMKDLGDDQIAQQLGLSRSHFRHLFRKSTGQPFYQYVVALRLERARELLAEETLTVQEVAARVGFGSTAHFSRLFQRRFKVAPSTMRQRARNASESLNPR